MNDLVRFDLAVGMDLAGISVRELWWRYAALGGNADLPALADRIAGLTECDDGEHDLIAQVLNEIFFDSGLKTFPVGYREPYRPLPRAPLPCRPVADRGLHRARQRAAEARQRSAEAARQAAELHLTAARLMHTSGQLKLAGRAYARAFNAFVRSRQAAVRSTG